MYNRSDNKKFVGAVNGVPVGGKTYKEYIMNYLQELADQYSNLKPQKRVDAYINYFVSNFNYDYEYANRMFHKDLPEETRATKEHALFRLLHSGVGVSEQFAQAFSLLCCISELNKDNIVCEYSCCNLKVDNTKISHAINHICIDKQTRLALDLGSIIYCKGRRTKANKNDFCLIDLQQYEQNLNSMGVEMLFEKNSDFKFVNYYSYIDKTIYYIMLTTPTKMYKKQQGNRYGIDIEHQKEKSI